MSDRMTLTGWTAPADFNAKSAVVDIGGKYFVVVGMTDSRNVIVRPRRWFDVLLGFGRRSAKALRFGRPALGKLKR